MTTIITFHSFDGWSPARGRNSAAQLLEIDVPISVHVQSQKQPKTDHNSTQFVVTSETIYPWQALAGMGGLIKEAMQPKSN